ncbi:unnamed protein product [Parajaminaea phylloscopi]
MTSTASPARAGDATPAAPAAQRQAQWALVRHYSVLLSADKDKGESSRMWHDGRLAQHTYNGKLVLYDEADVEVASTFATAKAQLLLPEDHQVDIEGYIAQIQSFQRVTRTDISVLTTRTRPETKRGSDPSVSSPSPSRPPRPLRSPRGPSSTHVFKTPFKRRTRPDGDGDGDDGDDGDDGRSTPSAAKRRLGCAAGTSRSS